MGILTQFIRLKISLKESLKYSKIYIVGSGKRLFSNKK